MILPPIVQRRPLAEGYLCYEIDNPQSSTKITRHGAHLIEWRPLHAKQPVIYTSPDAIFEEGTAIRGGIPICWPWFGAHPTSPDTHPSHGIARNRFWKVTEASERKEETHLALSLLSDDLDEETQALFPHDFELKYTLTLGTTLTLALTTTNTGDKPMTIGGALHTYFYVGDITQVHFSGLEKVSHLDFVERDKNGKPTEKPQGSTLIHSEVDRLYRGGGPVTIHDDANARQIIVHTRGSKSTVVWNPWIEKSKTLKDLPNEAYKNFLCVETANADKDTITLEPGESHTLGATIELITKDGPAPLVPHSLIDDVNQIKVGAKDRNSNK